MAVLPPTPKCPHGVPHDRFVPCATCDPKGYRAAAAHAPPGASLPDLDSRLRRLEAVVAYAERPIVSSGFEITLPPANPDAGERGYSNHVHTYQPIEAEYMHGYSLEPLAGVWVTSFQIGRQYFLNNHAMATADMRRLCVAVDPATGRADAARVYPTVGASLHLQNRAPHPVRVRGAFLVEPIQWVELPTTPMGMPR